jgi:enoyl-[acyl-carrier protein] reductase I
MTSPIASDFLGLAGRSFLIAGVANKKSVGFVIGQRLVETGAQVLWAVRSEKRRQELTGKLPGAGAIHVCDVEREEDIEALATTLEREQPSLHGLVHSIAYANYSSGWKPFHQTRREDFLQAVNISCFSLIRLAEALRPRFVRDASVVTISISTTRMAAENYGYMAPIKAALDSSVAFLAKSFSSDSEVRFNAVKAGLLKTSSSAGIPGYLESYLFAEAAIPRKRGLETREVADAAVFLLSPRSSGINGQGLVVDAGMEFNYFDRDLVRRATRPEGPPSAPR